MESSSPKNVQEIRSNPKELCKLISKYVEINLLKNTVLKGFISSVDPITNSIILLVPQENQMQYEKVLVPGHAVLDIAVVESETDVPISFTLTTTCTDHRERKEKLMEWFKLNLLTVTECEENIQFGNVTILPPYTVEDICTDNPIIAMQVQKVIEKMPDDLSKKISKIDN